MRARVEKRSVLGWNKSIVLEGDDKLEHKNEWRTYREKKSRLERKYCQAFSMIQGQCVKVLPDKMKHYPYWYNTSESYDPLTLLNIIDKTVPAQTEDQYCYDRM